MLGRAVTIDMFSGLSPRRARAAGRLYSFPGMAIPAFGFDCSLWDDETALTIIQRVRLTSIPLQWLSPHALVDLLVARGIAGQSNIHCGAVGALDEADDFAARGE